MGRYRIGCVWALAGDSERAAVAVGQPPPDGISFFPQLEFLSLCPVPEIEAAFRPEPG